MAHVAPGYASHSSSGDDGYYAQHQRYQGGPPPVGEQYAPQGEQELAWYYHQQQQHQLYMQQQWEEQQRQIHFQSQSGYQADDFYDEETAIKSEAIEAAYDQFYDDFMRAGPSVPSPPRRGSSALAPIAIQDDYEAPNYPDPYQDHPQTYRRSPPDYQHDQYPDAVPSRPPPRTHHSLPIAASSSSIASSSSPSTSLDHRVVRSERSTPLAADSSLSAKLGVKLKRGREQHRIGNQEWSAHDESGLPARGEEQEVKLHDASSGQYGDHVQGHAGQPDQGVAFDYDNYDEGRVSSSTSSLATLNPTPTRKKPGRPRGSRELASINPTPLPLTPKKLRNGRVRDRSRESSASEGSSSEEEEEKKDRQKDVRHEVYRPQYRLARPYRRRVPGVNGEKGTKARPAKERSLKTSPPADSAEETVASPPAQLAVTPAWTKPWILSRNEGDEEDNAVPSYPEVHYFVRWMHDAYHAQRATGDQRELVEQWGLSSMPPNSQEEATKQRATVREESRAIDTSGKSKKRDAQDDEDDAAVACLLFSDEAERPAEGKLEASPVPPIASPAATQPPLAHENGAASPPAAAPASPPPTTSAAPSPGPPSPSPLWLATIATRISILDTPEALLPARPRGTPQDYPRLLRQHFSARVRGGAESQSVARGGREAGEERNKAAGAPSTTAPSPLEDLHRVSIALPTAAGKGRRGVTTWPCTLETKPLWEHLVARYRAKRAQGSSHEEALWCGPALPLLLSGEREEGEEQEQEQEQEEKQKRARAPLILKRNLPRERRAG